MSEPREQPDAGAAAGPGPEPAAPSKPAVAEKTRPQRTPPKREPLPPYKVLLHNDDVNDMVFVVETLLALTPLTAEAATRVMLEAHRKGLAMVLLTHKERAELYQEQFASKGLVATIEPG